MLNKKNKKKKQNKTIKSKGNRVGRSGLNTNSAFIQAYGRVYQDRLNFIAPWFQSSMRYGDTIAIAVAAASTSEYIFRANSIFDPDRTGGGHQPSGRDQMALIYNKYRVDKLTWYLEIPSSTLTYHVGVVLVNGTQTFSALSNISETPTGRVETVGFNGAPSAKFVGHKLLAPFNGRSELVYNTSDETGAVMSTNPVEVMDLHIVVENPNLLTAVTAFVIVSLKYRTVFYDPIVPAPSFKKVNGDHH